MSLLLSVVCCAALHTPVRPVLDYETTAVPLSKALEELSKQSGTVLKASAQVGREIVVLRFQGSTVDEVKTRIAKAVSGTWSPQADGTELLTADVAKQREEERTALSNRAKRLQEGLANLAELAKDKPKAKQPKVEGDQGESEESIGYVASAQMKLLSALAQGLRANDLAAIQDGGRVVYSTVPNVMQRPLGGRNLNDLVAGVVVEHNKTAGTRNELEGIDNEQLEKIRKATELLGIEMPKPPTKITEPVAKILLVIERRSFAGMDDSGLNLTARLFDAKGKVLVSIEHTLGGSFFDSAPVQAVDEPAEGGKEPVKKEPQDPELSKAFERSALTTEFLKATNVMEMGGRKKPSEELVAALLHPETRDPLSFDVAEGILAVAAAKKWNVAACLPDNAVSIEGQMMGKDQNLASVFSQLKTNEALTVSDAGGWLEIRPSDPSASRRNRLDRAALGVFLRSAHSKVIPSLDDIATYASNNPPLTRTPAALGHVVVLCSSIIMTVFDPSQWEVLRLYSTLNASQRASLKGGSALLFSSLTPLGKASVNQMVYGAGCRFQVGAAPPQRPIGFLMFASNAGNGSIDDFRQEPTELIPNGLPMQGTVTLTVNSGNFVMPAGETSGFASLMSAMGPEETGMFWGMLDTPEMAQASGFLPKFDKFQVGDRDEMLFTLHVAPDVRQDHALTDNRIDAKAPIVGKDGLPKSFMDRAKVMMDYFKEGLGPLIQMGMGNATKPPQS
ncbi:MAG: hypothetical protein JSS66_09405 [Armatimonadetes bacterium]|nr:hypothetical protein [Armatimonadota bacterium]